MEYLPFDMAAPIDLTAANRNSLSGPQQDGGFDNLENLQ